MMNYINMQLLYPIEVPSWNQTSESILNKTQKIFSKTYIVEILKDASNKIYVYVIR